MFTFFRGLDILVALVILGVSSLGAAAGAGLFIGGPALANLFPSLAQLSSVMIGTAGVGLGQNPNGVVPTDLRPKFDPVLRAPAVLGGAAAIVAVAYVLTLTDVIGNWALIAVVLAVVVALPAASRRALGDQPDRVVLDAEADGLSAAPEVLGLAAPLSAADLAVLDKALDLPQLAATGGRS